MQTQVRPRVANAPLSYGAFEITVGTDFQVPDPEAVLGAIGAAGYAGTDLGPPGYLGEGEELQRRLVANELDLVGGFVPMRFSEPEHWDEDLGGLRHTLALFAAAGADRRAPGAVRRRRARADRQPRPRRRGRRAAPRRPSLGGADRRRRARGRGGPRRAGTSRSSTTTRRATSRACRRSSGSSRTPTSTCCSTAATSPWPAATRCRACATGASGSASSTSRTPAWTCSPRSARSGRT